MIDDKDSKKMVEYADYFEKKIINDNEKFSGLAPIEESYDPNYLDYRFFTESMNWYKKAIELGNGEAAYKYALFSEKHIKNGEKIAQKYYKKAKDLGYVVKDNEKSPVVEELKPNSAPKSNLKPKSKPKSKVDLTDWDDDNNKKPAKEEEPVVDNVDFYNDWDNLIEKKAVPTIKLEDGGKEPVVEKDEPKKKETGNAFTSQHEKPKLNGKNNGKNNGKGKDSGIVLIKTNDN
jgi:hypothetical protein